MPGGTRGEMPPEGWEPLDEDRPEGKTRFMVSLGTSQLTALRGHAARDGTTVADLIRRAVDEFLAADEG